MSVIIKGLDMPNTCGQCNLRALDEWEDEYCVVLCSDIEDHTKRLYSCPLVEIPKGHGRLYDERELKSKIHDVTLEGGILHGCIDKTEIHECKAILEAEG